MQIKDIAPDFAITPQITPDDMAQIAARGVTLIIANRPDGEEPDQPAFAEIAAAAAEHGIATVHIPVRPGQHTPDDVAREDAALSAATGPVLGYCKGGARAEAMWRATGRG